MTLEDAFTAYLCALSLRILRKHRCTSVKQADNDNQRGWAA